MKNVVFRADASVSIGSGHVMRCLTIARELRERGARCVFICREHRGNLVRLLESEGFMVCRLPSIDEPECIADSGGSSGDYSKWLGVTREQDALECQAIIEGMTVDWLVVDHYALDWEWEESLGQKVGRVMVIDDLANRKHLCDLLLDQNLGRQVEDYASLVPLTCKCLVGPHYALLRSEFLSFRKQSLARRSVCDIKHILISLGGVDKHNVTEWVMSLLSESDLPDAVQLDVVMGAASPNLDSVMAAARASRFSVKVSVNVENMAERMSMSDLSVGAAGSTVWERACVGLPSLMVVLADNQIHIAESVHEFGAAIILDKDRSIEESAFYLNKLLDSADLLVDIGKKASTLCDGEGCYRVVDAMAEFCA